MGNTALAPLESSKHKAEPARMPAMKPSRSMGIPSFPNFLSAAGNMAIQRAASGPLTGNPAAAAILGGANTSGGGCTCSTGSCEKCKKKPMQRKSESDAPAPAHDFHSALSRSGGGAPLAAHTRTMMEDRFGHNFDDVRIHSDGAAAEAARNIHAHAFTTGRDIYFGQGRYEPHTIGGQKLLAHELTHVLQQRQGVVQPGLKSLNATAHDDVFEREAEHVEKHFDRHEHGVAAIDGAQQTGIGHSALGGKSVQRKCGCGGTCAKCSGETAATVAQEMKKPPVQRKAEESPVARNKTRRRHESAEQSAPTDKTVQRKCSCGGTCAKCSGQSEQITAATGTELKKSQLQRKAEDAPVSKATAPCNQQRDAAVTPASQEQTIQRKCACGGTCSKCSEEESKTPAIQRKAENTPEPAREKTNAPRENKAVNERQGRKERPRRERNVGPTARAGAQARNRGLRLVRSGRQLAVQRASAGSAGAQAITRSDKLEREANAAAHDVIHGRKVSAEKVSELGQQTILPFDWEWCNPLSDPDCGFGSTAEVVAGETAEIAGEVWDEAKALADAIGGFLSWINNLLTITIPPMHLLDAHSLQVDLPEIGTDIPFLAGAVPIAPGVQIYGEVGLHLGIIPELGLQVGPFDTHAITIALHPLTLGGEIDGGFDLTIAGLLGGEARAGLFGEVGVIIEWPDPPIVLKVPLANIQAGLSGTLRGIIGDQMSVDFHAGAGITGVSFSTSQNHNFGFAIDLGLGGYGQLTVLGINLCTLRWPLYEAHKDATLNLGFDFGFDLGLTSLPSISVPSVSGAFNESTFDDLGFQFQREMKKDDCPLCDFLYDMGLMPSQRGGGWTGHPAPAWPIGPLHGVYPRNPGIPSGSLCRGACGADCETCHHEHEHYECEKVGNRHIWWVYPQYETCGTHLGCRNHDACYDWCADKYNEKGKLGVILGPCHRLCDFECVCDYNLPQCVGWIGGGKPHDGTMVFSDKPHKRDGCDGPCPHKTGPQETDHWLMCLPTLELFPRKSYSAPPLDKTTGQHTLWRKDVWIPYVGLVTLEIYGSGSIHGDLSAGLGPGTISNICFDVDPHAGTYKARGELRLPADFLANLRATAELGADARWFLIVKVASAKGTLEAHASLAGNATLILSGQVAVSCAGGHPTLESDLDFPGCLKLKFDLDAGFEIKAVGFTVWTKKWKLLSANWDKCWGEDVSVKHTGKAPKIDLRDKTISLSDLLEWLLSDKAEETEPPSQQRQVKEDPLTTATAKTIPDLVPQLDQTSYGTGTVTLNSGASNVAGLDMMTRFLTIDHSPGSDSTGKAQKNIYGFRKLPTRGAFGGSGYSATQVYIKGHLLNADLGGPAEDKNLFPITGQANKDHNVDVEEKVKDLVKGRNGTPAPLVTMYGVRVTGQDGPHNVDVLDDGTCTYEYLNANFQTTFGTYKLFTDNTVELNKTTDTPIASTFDRSGFITGVKGKKCPEK